MTQVGDARSLDTPAPVVPSATRMSSRLWGVEWPEWTIAGLQCIPSSFAAAEPFIAEHYPSIFATAPHRFLEEKMTPAKRRFLDDSDVYLFRDGERDVGVWLGNPVDWSTYYARTIAILPDYRDRGVFNEFLARFIEPLRDVGVERVEGECSPANVPMNRALLGLGWLVTSTVNSERWGTLLRYTKHLTEASEACFRDQFINAPNIRLRPPRGAPP